MGYAEEAKILLTRAKQQGESNPLGLAQLYATLAVLDAVDELSSQVGYLAGSVDEQIDAAKKP
ncbi:hypothetical protein G3R41_08800 [Modestobacter muralis]|uniref:Uncharacterized protein n=1 Tax=Modestobacter muralis TaxID=1608614 RepID=A0A6P0H5I2_9ACTN|nr:hypothetical protein [Modestobacter muralis]NEN51037.1 hypothetical protein [Modestobacter muralis]